MPLRRIAPTTPADRRRAQAFSASTQMQCVPSRTRWGCAVMPAGFGLTELVRADASPSSHAARVWSRTGGTSAALPGRCSISRSTSRS